MVNVIDVRLREVAARQVSASATSAHEAGWIHYEVAGYGNFERKVAGYGTYPQRDNPYRDVTDSNVSPEAGAVESLLKDDEVGGETLLDLASTGGHLIAALGMLGSLAVERAGSMACMDTALEELASAHGVATWYRDARRRRVDVEPNVVRRVLGLLGVNADTPAQVQAALAATRQPGLPGTIVLRQGQSLDIRAPGLLTDEHGAEMPVRDALPADLAPGWYSLTSGERHTTVLVAPPMLPQPPHTWGWMLQLYALRSAQSWGIGDLADLAALNRWAGGLGARFLLLNPLHSALPGLPQEASPYYPSSRRFLNPLYLRLEG